MTDEQQPSPGGTGRRPLLRLAAGGVALVTVGTTARLTLHPGDDRGARSDPGALALTTQDGSDVASLHLPLGEDLLPRTGVRRWESLRLPTTTHSMVALTWDAREEPPQAQVRSRTAAGWGAWTRLPALHDLPEEATEDPSLAGTDLVWIGRADGVQVRVEGRRPAGLALVLLHPARRAGDPFLGERTARVAAEASEEPQRAPRPALVTRKEWGADGSLRDGRPSYNDTLKQVHVHHTVNANDYSRDDVPALIRGMYAYHTQTLGWSDIGYNFLVDRFGRAFVGRAGGPDRLVRGAHTLGFNAESTGISAIGNYEAARPSLAMLDAIAAVAAWKLDTYDRSPTSTVRVESEGSDKYAAGRTVELPVIDGHRDTNDTACPGGRLYEALPKVRRRAAAIIAAARQTAIEVTRGATVTGVARLGQELQADPGTWSPDDAVPTYRWLRGDRRIRGAREQAYTVRPWDVGQSVRCEVTLTREGSEPVVQTTDPTGPVTADPDVTVTPTVDGRVVRVAVTVAAPPDVRPVPGGSVTVSVGPRSRTVALTDGRARVRFGRHRRLGPGRYPVEVRYEGDPAFTAAAATGAVRVE